MKVILSRKGFDSGYGGYPSIIMPDNELITLPIPSSEDKVCYFNLKTLKGKSIYTLMKQLNKNIKSGEKVRLTPAITCHLDPDLVFETVDRKEGWRGAFGQISSAQKVLENNHVKEGDLFLFFGWFNNVEETENGYTFTKGSGKHTIFGYLQIDKIIYTHKDKVPKWLESHPHAEGYRRSVKESNCIYIARETCTFDENIKGYGTFEYNEELDLTKPGMTRTCWDLPDIFREVSMTYHNENSWKDDYFKSACRGQEFVIEENEKISEWAIELIKKYSVNKVKETVTN